MTKAILLATVCTLTLPVVSATAQTTDMAKIECDDLSHAYVEDYLVVASWMSGYYNAKHGNTKLDAKKIAGNSKRVAEFCKSNPSMTVMKAIEQLSKAKN